MLVVECGSYEILLLPLWILGLAHGVLTKLIKLTVVLRIHLIHQVDVLMRIIKMMLRKLLLELAKLLLK